jgi:hypothetical protein
MADKKRDVDSVHEEIQCIEIEYNEIEIIKVSCRHEQKNLSTRSSLEDIFIFSLPSFFFSSFHFLFVSLVL